MWDPREEVESVRLPNGLTVYSVYWPNRPWVSMGFMVHSGAYQDGFGLEGTAHFLEHMVSRNAMIPYPLIREFFENDGGEVMLGSTGYLKTTYSFFVSLSGLEKALEIFSSILLTSPIKNYIEEQRQVILGEFERRYPIKPILDLAWRKNRNVFDGTYVERHVTPMGAPNSIRSIAKADLQEYYDNNYTPANMSIVCVGGLKLDDLVEKLFASGFGNLKPGVRSDLPKVVDANRHPRQTRHVFEFSKHIKMDKPRESGDYVSSIIFPGTIPAETFRILRRMIDKVLFDEVRERRGWTYSISASLASNPSLHEFDIKAEALRTDSLGEVESVINTCLESVSSRDDLFRNAVSHYIASSRMEDISGNGLRKMLMSDLTRSGRVVTNAETDQVAMSLSMEDVTSLLSQMGPERRYTVLAIP